VKNRRREHGEASFDLAGAITLTGGQIVLVYGIVTAGIHGWGSPDGLIPIAVGVGLLALFVVIESRFVAAPLVPFRDLTKPVHVANAIVLLFSAGLFPMWYVTSLYLQQVLGLSPLDAGLTFLPMALTIMVTAQRAGRLVSRFGVRLVLGSGLLMMTAGLLLFSRIEPTGSAVALVILPGVLTAAGIGLAVVSSTIAATHGAREGQAGLASGLVNTSRQAGGGLGLALLITLATQYTTDLVGTNEPVSDALTQGFRLAYLIAAGLVAAAAVVTFALVRERSEEGGRVVHRRTLATVVALVVAALAGTYFAVAGKGAAIGDYTTKQTLDFVSAPSLHPPKIETGDTDTSKLGPGLLLTASFYHVTRPPMVGQSGPLILDNHMQPVWFNPVPEDVVASNLTTQTYQGKPVLAWWQGVITSAGISESGEYVIVDQHYEQVARLRAKKGWILTLHSLVIDGDHAWVTANKNVALDLSKYGGSYNGTVIDSAVQEYDLRSGKLLRSWSALDHIPLADSYALPQLNGFPWDAYHINWISPVGKGKLLVSMRDTWAAYLLDVDAGRIEWTLGGKHSTFDLEPEARFEWQHDVTLHPGSVVTLFDDHCCQVRGADTWLPATAPSRGLVLKLDQDARRVTLLSEYGKEHELAAAYMGNAQPLENGNVLVGWGSEPFFSEYSKSGKLLMYAKFPDPDIAYRVNRERWVGMPLDRPRGAARAADGETTVYASWNGATEVASWKVLAGQAGQERVVTTANRAGFETAIPVGNVNDRFVVEAVARDGHVLGASRPFRPETA
jgi:MFS family permease